MTGSSQPVRLVQSQIRVVTAMMGKAFVNDPFLRYLAPNEVKRSRLTPEFVGACRKLLRELWRSVDNRQQFWCRLLADTWQDFAHVERYVEDRHVDNANEFWLGRLSTLSGGGRTIQRRCISSLLQSRTGICGAWASIRRSRAKGTGGALLQPILAQADKPQGCPVIWKPKTPEPRVLSEAWVCCCKRWRRSQRQSTGLGNGAKAAVTLICADGSF